MREFLLRANFSSAPGGQAAGPRRHRCRDLLRPGLGKQRGPVCHQPGPGGPPARLRQARHQGSKVTHHIHLFMTYSPDELECIVHIFTQRNCLTAHRKERGFILTNNIHLFVMLTNYNHCVFSRKGEYRFKPGTTVVQSESVTVFPLDLLAESVHTMDTA